MSTPVAERTAEWFFDFVSPFAYLQLEQFEQLPAAPAATRSTPAQQAPQPSAAATHR